MLFSMKPLSIYKQPPLLLHNDRGIFKERRLIKYSSSFNSCCIVHALKEDSKQYEIDPEKAKEALKELDQKIQSISSREASSPKLKASTFPPFAASTFYAFPPLSASTFSAFPPLQASTFSTFPSLPNIVTNQGTVLMGMTEI